jgi:hypothetical protein
MVYLLRVEKKIPHPVNKRMGVIATSILENASGQIGIALA